MNRWKDWYEQGKRDREKADLDYKNSYFEWTCFTIHQSVEKVIKALFLKLGYNVWGHSTNEMLKILSQNIEVPQEFIDNAKLIDLYYIPSRYPNGFPSGKPADFFTEKQAKEAIDAADNIIRFCEDHLFK